MDNETKYTPICWYIFKFFNSSTKTNTRDRFKGHRGVLLSNLTTYILLLVCSVCCQICMYIIYIKKANFYYNKIFLCVQFYYRQLFPPMRSSYWFSSIDLSLLLDLAERKVFPEICRSFINFWIRTKFVQHCSKILQLQAKSDNNRLLNGGKCW